MLFVCCTKPRTADEALVVQCERENRTLITRDCGPVMLAQSQHPNRGILVVKRSEGERAELVAAVLITSLSFLATNYAALAGVFFLYNRNNSHVEIIRRHSNGSTIRLGNLPSRRKTQTKTNCCGADAL